MTRPSPRTAKTSRRAHQNPMKSLSLLIAACLSTAATTNSNAQTTPAPKAAPAAKKSTARTPARVAAKPAPLPAADTEKERAELARDRQQVEQLRATTLGLIRLMIEEGVVDMEKVVPMLDPASREQLGTIAPKRRAPPPAAAGKVERGDTGAAPPVAPTEEGVPPKPEMADADSQTASTSRRKAPKTVRIPYVPDVVKEEIREEIKQEVLAQAKSERWAEPGTLPEWLDRIAWDGDMRLRYQGESFDGNNISPSDYGQAVDLDPFNPSLSNTRHDEALWRIRVRIGMLAKLSERLGAGFRIATGTTDNPVSTNASLGRGRDRQGGLQLTLDRAYLKWDPLPWISASAGRMPNPWFWPTDLVWDEDLNFEGLAASVRPQVAERATVFATAGAFPLQIQASNPDVPDPQDKWLFGVQAGGEWTGSDGLRVKFGAALFDYQNIEGRPNPATSNPSVAPGPNDWSRPFYRQKGNSRFNINQNTLSPTTVQMGLSSKFRLINLGGELDFVVFDPFVVKIGGDYVKNIGFDAGEIRARTGTNLEAQTDGYQAKITLGRDAIRALHDWQVFFGYRYLERDAVLDAFTDSDFNLGGTNTKGFFIGGFYGLDRNAAIRIRYLSADAITPFAVSGANLPLSIDVLQADLNVRF